MPFPFVSRRAFDLLMDERDRLRRQNDELLEHRMRLERKDAGMTEVPVDKRPKPEPMPVSLAEKIAELSNSRMRSEAYRDAALAHSEGKSWDMIERDFDRNVGEEA